jgi:prophage antirepressor-like protein
MCAEALGIIWAGDKTLSAISDKWKMSVVIPDSSGTGRKQKTIFINEAALYKLAFRSNKPEAETFGLPISYVKYSCLIRDKGKTEFFVTI